MEILKYTAENLETIAKEKRQPIEEVTADYDMSIELGTPIYSVKNFISFGNGEINHGAYFISVEIFEQFYREDAPQRPNKYTKASLRYPKLRPT